MKRSMTNLLSTMLITALMTFTAQAKDISQNDLIAQLDGKNKPVVIDVRTEGEYAKGHVPGALNIPHKQLKSRLAEITQYKDTEVILYCRSGKRAGIAKTILKGNGFNKLAHLEGDFNAWSEKKLPVEMSKMKKLKSKVKNPCAF